MLLFSLSLQMPQHRKCFSRREAGIRLALFLSIRAAELQHVSVVQLDGISCQPEKGAGQHEETGSYLLLPLTTET